MTSDTGKRVFIVDDMPLIASTLGTIFERAGFVSASYEDPLELLKACEQDVPDAVISDVMMPQMTGTDLALRLRDLYPACKVILISGMVGAPNFPGRGLQQGNVLQFMEKPSPPNDLVQHVRKALS